MAAIKIKGATVNFPTEDGNTGELTAAQVKELKKDLAIDCPFYGERTTLFRCTSNVLTSAANGAATNIANATGYVFSAFPAVWASSLFNDDGEVYGGFFAFLAEMLDPNSQNLHYILYAVEV